MTKIDTFLSVVAPLRDDGDIVESFVEELLGVLEQSFTHYEVVLVDEGSTDDTVAKVDGLLGKHDFLRLIRLSRRFGTEVAILAGMESVIGDWVIVAMPDTDPPELIPRLIELGRDGYPIVSGVRKIGGGEPWRISVLAPVFYWYVNRVLRLGIPKNTTEFRALDRRAVNAILGSKDMLRFMRMYSAYVGFPNTTLEYEMRSRRGLLRKRGFLDAARRSAGIIVANSTHPLRFVSALLVVVGLANAILDLVNVFDYPTGWNLVSGVTRIVFWFLFVVTVAVLCHYVARILEENSDLPRYFVLEERASSVTLDEERRRNVVGESKPDA